MLSLTCLLQCIHRQTEIESPIPRCEIGYFAISGICWLSLRVYEMTDCMYVVNICLGVLSMPGAELRMNKLGLESTEAIGQFLMS